MCQTVVKQISKIKNGAAVCGQNRYQILYEKAKPGDYVLVCGNIVLKKISQKEAKELDEYAT